MDDGVITTGANAWADLKVEPINDEPELSGVIAFLANVQEDIAYTITAEHLLQGYSDIDGDTLSVTDLSASVGTIADNNDGTWTLTAPQDFNGEVELSYNVSDGNGGTTPATQTFSILLSTTADDERHPCPFQEDGGTRLITTAELLANAADVDGDTYRLQSRHHLWQWFAR